MPLTRDNEKSPPEAGDSVAASLQTTTTTTTTTCVTDTPRVGIHHSTMVMASIPCDGSG